MCYKQKFFTSARIMSIFAFFVLIIASIMSYNHTPISYVIFPKPEITVFIINITCAILCIFSIINPQNYKLQCSVFFVQGITTSLTNYPILGIFLYLCFLVLAFCHGFFKTHAVKKFSLFAGIWLIGCLFYAYECYVKYSSRWIWIALLQLFISIFFFSFYLAIYRKLESLLIPLIPTKQVIKTNLELPEPGSELELARLGLTSRQTNLLKEYLKSQCNYEELSREFMISKSTVKKDMADIFVKFGVSNIKELQILLIQYVIK